VGRLHDRVHLEAPWWLTLRANPATVSLRRWAFSTEEDAHLLLRCSFVVSKFDPHVVSLNGHVGMAVPEVRKGFLGRLREMVSGGHFDGEGIDHLTVFDE
jgi:hypothetical protein